MTRFRKLFRRSGKKHAEALSEAEGFSLASSTAVEAESCESPALFVSNTRMRRSLKLTSGTKIQDMLSSFLQGNFPKSSSNYSYFEPSPNSSHGEICTMARVNPAQRPSKGDIESVKSASMIDADSVSPLQIAPVFEIHSFGSSQIASTAEKVNPVQPEPTVERFESASVIEADNVKSASMAEVDSVSALQIASMIEMDSDKSTKMASVFDLDSAISASMTGTESARALQTASMIDIDSVGSAQMASVIESSNSVQRSSTSESVECVQKAPMIDFDYVNSAQNTSSNDFDTADSVQRKSMMESVIPAQSTPISHYNSENSVSRASMVKLTHENATLNTSRVPLSFGILKPHSVLAPRYQYRITVHIGSGIAPDSIQILEPVYSCSPLKAHEVSVQVTVLERHSSSVSEASSLTFSDTSTRAPSVASSHLSAETSEASFYSVSSCPKVLSCNKALTTNVILGRHRADATQPQFDLYNPNTYGTFGSMAGPYPVVRPPTTSYSGGRRISRVIPLSLPYNNNRPHRSF